MENRIKKRKKAFTQISNKIAKDQSLSLKSKGMALVIAHFPDDWIFYEEKLQDYTRDGRSAIATALKELENEFYLYREQLREKGRYSSKVWIFNDEGLTIEEIKELCPECRLSEIGVTEIGKSTTTNTHSNNIKEDNKKNTQKRSRKKDFYKFVNILKQNAEEYPRLKIKFENRTFSFSTKNGQLLIRDDTSKKILSKLEAEKIYKKMANSINLEILRGVGVNDNVK